MKSLKIYKDNKGFSVIEAIVTLGIIALILSMGFFIAPDFFESHYFISEERLTASLLRVARSRAINNLNQSAQGLFISRDKFVLFQGDSFDPEDDMNEDFPKNISINISSDFENEKGESIIIFSNLTGQSVPERGTITLKDARRTGVIDIHPQGRIEW